MRARARARARARVRRTSEQTMGPRRRISFIMARSPRTPPCSATPYLGRVRVRVRVKVSVRVRVRVRVRVSAPHVRGRGRREARGACAGARLRGGAAAAVAHGVADAVARRVRLARLIRDDRVREVLVHQRRVAAIAPAGRPAGRSRRPRCRHAVEQRLPAQPNVRRFGTPGDLNPIVERRGGRVNPARPTGLRQMNGLRHKREPVHRSPVVGKGQLTVAQ